MSLTQLRTPFLEGGIRSTNFFNGRLLSGEAMSTEQAAVLERACRLGQAVGSGVAYGLEVQLNTAPASSFSPPPTGPVLTVAAGLAINRCGQVVKLTQPVDVALVRPPSAAGVATAARTFGCCQPPTAGGQLTGDGIYLFTIAPTSANEGRAAVNGLGGNSAKCNSQNLVECAQFNRIALPQIAPYLSADDFSPANLPRLRNRIAYRCFGVTALASALQDPYNTYLHEYGVVDALRSSGALSPAEVPLALLYWTKDNGIEFVDMWAVRRRVTALGLSHDWLGASVSERLLSEGEAMILQFLDHWRDLVRTGAAPLAGDARNYFSNLPPIGFLTLEGVVNAGSPDLTAFFSSMAARGPLYVAGGKIGAMLRTACSVPPIQLGTQELVWLYWVRENLGGGVPDWRNAGAPVILFTSPHLHYEAEARFNADYFNFANFELA